MNSKSLNRITNHDHFKEIKSGLIWDQKSSKVVFCSPLYGVSKSLLALNLFETEGQIVLLLPDSKSAEEINVELNILGLGDSLILFEEFTPEAIQERLTKISKLKKFVLISTYNLLVLNLPVKEQLEKTTTLIQPGEKVGYAELIEYLNFLNYQKEKFVGAPGEFSIRGSIIDFWSYSERNPVRLEYDGDFLESIRFFDPESQRSIEKTESVSLSGSLKQEGELTSGIFDYLDKPLMIASSFELQNLNHTPPKIFNGEKYIDEKNELIKEFDLDDEFPEPVEKETQSLAKPEFAYNDFLKKEGTRWIIEEEISTSQSRIELGFSQVPAINSNYEILFKVLKDYSDKNFEIVIASENELQTTRLKELLSEFKVEIADLIETGKLKLETLPVKEGFIYSEGKLLLLTDYQIFNKPYRTKLSERKKYKKSKSKAFASIKNGDYVVHETYGIGKYAGLQTINIGETKQESMKLHYNEGGVVYVNLNYLNLVKRYSSSENLKPTLSTLGSGEWERRKNRTKKKIKEAARELIELYAKRKATKGFQFSLDSIWQKELEASFFYEDTPDQEKVTSEVKYDMEAENPMDRLVCGDVGFGKTEVAVRA